MQTASAEITPLDGSAERYLDDREAASILGVSTGHLRNLRVRGGGPRFYRLGSRSIRYLVADLHRWARARPATSTSDRVAA